jgi:holo-[acyl-carrier protein] synthase
MIIGIGQDVVDVRRIAATLVRFGPRFENRIFTPHEQARANRKTRKAETYAKRWAAKEACAKALGTGMNQGVAWRHIGVENLPSGQPTLILTGGASKRLQSLIPSGYKAAVHLTLSDDGPNAQALVIIEAVPHHG